MRCRAFVTLLYFDGSPGRPQMSQKKGQKNQGEMNKDRGTSLADLRTPGLHGLPSCSFPGHPRSSVAWHRTHLGYYGESCWGAPFALGSPDLCLWGLGAQPTPSTNPEKHVTREDISFKSVTPSSRFNAKRHGSTTMLSQED